MNPVSTIEGILSERTGVAPDTLGPEAVRMGAEKRSRALDCGSLDGYLALLRENEEEWGRLIDEIVVPESWFFRDKAPFERLSEAVRKRMSGIGPASPLRLLSTPCATGEEPYSMCMALLDLGLRPGSFRIKGVDISERVVGLARAGTYGPLSFRGEDLAFRNEYFEPVGSGRYRIRPILKGRIEFGTGNLTDPDFLRDDPPYDVVFCRNVMIYLEAEARKRALSNLDRLLAPEGLLFVGHAEASTEVLRMFAPRKWPGAFAFGKRIPGKDIPPSSRSRASSFQPSPPGARSRSRPSSRSHAGRKRPVPAPAIREEPRDPVRAPRGAPAPEGRAGLDLDRAQELANSGQILEARLICEQFIRSSGYDARACYLLGIINLADGKDEEAKLQFGRTVYLKPTHGDAMIHLIHLALASGEKQEAARWQHRLERITSRAASQ